MNEDFEFQKWGSIKRLFRPILITEKLDGTNAHINIIPKELVTQRIDSPEWIDETEFIWGEGELGEYGMLVGSRKRYLSHHKDNYGFWQWVYDNRDELTNLGAGRHYGEWWGSKIQRNYGIGERRFSLFNVMRYNLDPSLIPACCHVVPLLYAGPMDQYAIIDMLQMLERDGSKAAPGYMNPEGIVIFHTHSNTLFKYTLKGDQHKSQVMDDKLEALQEVIV